MPPSQCFFRLTRKLQCTQHTYTCVLTNLPKSFNSDRSVNINEIFSVLNINNVSFTLKRRELVVQGPRKSRDPSQCFFRLTRKLQINVLNIHDVLAIALVKRGSHVGLLQSINARWERWLIGRKRARWPCLPPARDSPSWGFGWSSVSQCLQLPQGTGQLLLLQIVVLDVNLNVWINCKSLPPAF